jgi:hypothetical protein
MHVLNAGRDLPEQQRRAKQFLVATQHAMNHILQEDKFVWDPRRNDLFVTGSRNPLNRDTRINLAAYCTAYVAAAPRGRAPPCDLIDGQASFSIVSTIFGNLLQYDVESTRILGPASVTRVIAQLREIEFLGALFDLGGGHWTAVTQYQNSCRKRVADAQGRPSIVNFRWSYIDSLAPEIYTCSDNLDDLLRDAPFTHAILIKNRAECYKSVSIDQLELERGRRNRGVGGPIMVRGVWKAPVLPPELPEAPPARPKPRSSGPTRSVHAENNWLEENDAAAPAAAAAAPAPRRGGPTRSVHGNNNMLTVVSESPNAGEAPVRRSASPHPRAGRAAVAAAAASPPLKGILKKGGRTRKQRKQRKQRQRYTRST